MSLVRETLEKKVVQFLEKVVEQIRKDTSVLGKWVLYVPDTDTLQFFNTRDEALKYVYDNLYNAKYIFLIQIPFESEESFYGFAKMILKFLNIDLQAELQKLTQGEKS